MYKKYLYKNFWVVLVFDILLLSFSYFLAQYLRFEFKIPQSEKIQLLKFFPILLSVKLVCMFYFDLYSGMWRYTSIRDLSNIIKAFTTGLVVSSLYLFFMHRFVGFSRGAFLIDYVLSIFFIGGARLLVRSFFENKEKLTFNSTNGSGVTTRRTLIMGAGNAGEKLLREIKNNPSAGYIPVGFLDDRASKVGRKIHGVPVLGKINDALKIVKNKSIDEIIIAIPSATTLELKNIVEQCKKAKVLYKTLPPLSHIIEADISLKSLKKVVYEDLLGRQTVKLDEKDIDSYINNKVVLVTGAGGSIGSILCQKIAGFKPSKIVLFEIAETPLYEIDLTLKDNFPYIEVVPVIGDINDKNLLEETLECHKPDLVFHAAAYKHVPMMELNPRQAFLNNVMGTKTVLEAVTKYEVKKFILVSTDKAVNPTSVMGATKKLAELLTLSYNKKSKTACMAVRFGNVLGSAGSVIPLFEKQIKKGGPITITHPDIKRFFMTIPEACLLILQAGSMGSGGEIFVLDMGEQKKIYDVAREMIEWHGLKPNVDIKINFIGLRPGEKLYEELNTDYEKLEPTKHIKINVLYNNNFRDICVHIENIAKTIKSENSLKTKIKEIVPEYIFN